MQKFRIALIYSAALAASIGIFFLIRLFGRSLVAPEASVPLSSGSGAAPHLDFALTQVLLALIVIVIAARLLGAIFRRMNQPEVIGEMIAGILLGPSLLGHVAPGLSAQLFSPAVMPFLSVIAQIGVILYMFLVGVELDTETASGIVWESLSQFLEQASSRHFCSGSALGTVALSRALHARRTLHRIRALHGRRDVGDRVSRAGPHSHGLPNAKEPHRHDCSGVRCGR